jgi:hypothetical protein
MLVHDTSSGWDDPRELADTAGSIQGILGAALDGVIDLSPGLEWLLHDVLDRVETRLCDPVGLGVSNRAVRETPAG